jgi:hypothetical protein
MSAWQWLGAAMIAALFVAHFIIGARISGWRFVCLLYAGFAVMAGFVGIAVLLIAGDLP